MTFRQLLKRKVVYNSPMHLQEASALVPTQVPILPISLVGPSNFVLETVKRGRD